MMGMGGGCRGWGSGEKGRIVDGEQREGEKVGKGLYD